MELNSGIEYLVGDETVIANMEEVGGVGIFSDETMNFLEKVSKQLMSDLRSKSFPDVMTFAFWCRRANLTKMKKAYESELQSRVGLGLTFHIAPSNVAVNFAYSAVAALLAGNACVVRLPSKKFIQTDIICDAFNNAIELFEENGIISFKERVCFLKYPREKKINDIFSNICNARIVWGGDATINELRKSSIKERTKEINFADRYSIVIIDPKVINEELDLGSLSQSFYNDTYLSDQNACTSPRFIIWISDGTSVEGAKKIFWEKLYDIVKEKYEISGVQSVEKLTKAYELGAEFPDCKLVNAEDNLVTRVKVNKLLPEMINYYGNSGFFIEYDAKELNEILPLCTGRLQTVSYFGIDPDIIKKFAFENGRNGIDRIVEVGQTMDFSLIWDGYDIIRELSRRIVVQ